MQVRLEQDPLASYDKDDNNDEDDRLVDGVACAAIAVHDASDRRHDNAADEYYNLLTVVDAHRGVESVDVWAWAIDHSAHWAVPVAGLILN
jgi:hypothetical protein